MKTNKGFGIISVLLIVVGVLVVGGGAYYVGNKSSPISTEPIEIPDDVFNTPVNTQVNNTSPVNIQADVCNSKSPSTIKVLSPNGGEVYQVGEKITVKWKSCNVTPNSVGIILIKHNISVSYTQSEVQGDYAGFTLGGFDPYVGTADDGSQQVILPFSSATGFTSGQHYFIAVTGLGDATNIGSGYSPGDYSDNLFTINNNVQATTKTYKNSSASYEISYPSNWSVASKSEQVNYSNFQIKNNLGAVLPGANSNLRSMDSIISVQVSYGALPNGIDYKNYSTIDDFINDSKFGLSTLEVESRLAKISVMNIGGKSLRVLRLGNSASIAYSFVYNNKGYGINIMSGSQNQYNNDLKNFNDLISSFRFIN